MGTKKSALGAVLDTCTLCAHTMIFLPGYAFSASQMRFFAIWRSRTLTSFPDTICQYRVVCDSMLQTTWYQKPGDSVRLAIPVGPGDTASISFPSSSFNAFSLW